MADETGVKLVAVSIDDSRSASKVKPYVNASGWEYDIYIDSNRELARLMGVSTVPHTFLLNGDGKIVWEHKGYIEGDEDELYEQIEHIARIIQMKNVIILILLILSTKISLSQENYNPLEIRGNFETNLQSYFVDSSIGANEPTPERVLNNVT